MKFFREEEGVYKNITKEYETELSLHEGLLTVQFSKLQKGLFVPCFDLSQFECRYKCKKNRGNKCPYSQEVYEIISSEITYFSCRGKINEAEEKVKGWLKGVCEEPEMNEIICEKWEYENEKD